MSDPVAETECPPLVQKAFDRFGPPTEVFRGSPANVIAGFIIGAFMLAAGIIGTIFLVILILSEGFDIRLAKGILAPFLAVGGWLTLRWAYRNRRVRVYACPHGFVFEHPSGVTIFPWNEIVEVRQDFAREGLDENGYPHMKRDTTFLVRRADGAEFPFTPNLLKSHLKLARAIHTATRPYDVPWTLVRG